MHAEDPTKMFMAIYENIWVFYTTKRGSVMNRCLGFLFAEKEYNM